MRVLSSRLAAGVVGAPSGSIAKPPSPWQIYLELGRGLVLGGHQTREDEANLMVPTGIATGDELRSPPSSYASPSLWPEGPPYQRPRARAGIRSKPRAIWAALACRAGPVAVAGLGFNFGVFLLLISQIYMLCCKIHISHFIDPIEVIPIVLSSR
jgi:hypothetical protein